MMHGRFTRTILVALAVTCLLMAGCLFGGLNEIASLDLSVSKNVLSVGETAELSALGKTKRTVSVIPDWTIVAGAGTLRKCGFQASNWDCGGHQDLEFYPS